MTHTTAPGTAASAAGPGAVRQWWAPAAQAVAITVVLVVSLVQVSAARADIAADNGRGPLVDARPVPRQVAAPVTLGIPTLKITDRLLGLRKQRDGTLGVPADPQRAGWYSQGPAPGDPGPAVIVGHVDSYRGPGIFNRIRTLKKNDPIRIRRADGSLATFRVTFVRTYAKRNFPTELVYVGDGRPSLRLITCGGEFDRRSKRYLSNTIVFASLERPPLKKPAARKPQTKKPATSKPATKTPTASRTT